MIKTSNYTTEYDTGAVECKLVQLKRGQSDLINTNTGVENKCILKDLIHHSLL